MTFLHALWASLGILLLLDPWSSVRGDTGTPSDVHGGVPMGISNPVCDDAQYDIQLDWDPKSKDEYTCTETREKKASQHYFHCDLKESPPAHVCYPRPISYTEDLPTSGAHRPLWPQYGEYVYIPIQRWLHSLEHGAVVFLYHPCADPDQIEEFKAIARGCLRRHIISPYKKMPPEMDFAVLSWKCKLTLSRVDVTLIVDFVKTHALKGPENVPRDGQYNVGLTKSARVVSDLEDSDLCPLMSMMSGTAANVKYMSSARRIKSQQSQDNLARIMGSFMEGFNQ